MLDCLATIRVHTNNEFNFFYQLSRVIRSMIPFENTARRSRNLMINRWLTVCLLCYAADITQAVHATAADGRLQGPVQAIVGQVIDGDTLAVRARIWLD